LVTETKTRLVEPNITVFEILGRLSLGNSLQSVETTLSKLIDDGARKLVIDVAGLTHIDSAGVGMLVACNGRMEQQGGRVRVAGAQGSVEKTFEIVHLGRILPLDPDVVSACRNLSADGTAV